MLRATSVSVILLALAACSDAVVGPVDIRVPREAGPEGGRSDGLADRGSKTDVPAGTCFAAVESINGKLAGSYRVLTSAEDQDTGRPGLQIDVTVLLIGRPDGTPVELSVTGLATRPTATSAGGKASFANVTVDATLAVVSLRPEVPGCASAALLLDVQADPTCSFADPQQGTTLTQKHNKSPAGTSFVYDVRVNTANAATGQVILRVNGAQSGSVQAPNPLSGLAVFSDITLPSQMGVKLEAEVRQGALKATCSISVNIDTAAPACSLAKLEPPPRATAKGDGLGPAQDSDPAAAGLQTKVVVATEPGVDLVVLAHAGKSETATPSANQATFAITLEEGQQALQATCTDSSTGNTGKSNIHHLLVDTTPPPKPSSLACTVVDHRGGKVECAFPAVSDGSSGSGVQHYLLHYRQDSPIDASTFDAPGTLEVTPAPTVGPVAVTKLPFHHTYSFAIKAVDYLGNVSPISDASGPAKIDFKVQELVGEHAGMKLGYPVVTGDFNCDGYADLAVGLGGASSGAGEVQVFLASGTGLPATFSKKITGTVAGGLFGNSLAALQFDKDARGCTDLAVGAAGRDANRGRVYLYLGREIWTDRDDDGVGTGAEIIYKLPATAATGERLGVALAGPDLDGDGHDDLAMPHFLGEDGGWASVLVNYGAPGIPLLSTGKAPLVREMPASAELQITGGTSAASFGFSMARGGDLNGDTLGELLVGAPTHKSGTAQVGAAHLVSGQSRAPVVPEIVDITTSTRVSTITGISASGFFGATLATVGDFDGDGSREFLVGDPHSAVGGSTKAGTAYLFAPADTPKTAADARVVFQNDLPGGTGNVFARRLASGAEVHPTKGADLDKDGYPDIVIGSGGTGSSAVGSVFVFFGRASPPATIKASLPDVLLSPAIGGTTWYSGEIAFLADVNGDGYADIVATDIGFGGDTGKLYVYY